MADKRDDETCDQSSGTPGQANQDNEMKEPKTEQPRELTRENSKPQDNPKPTNKTTSFFTRTLAAVAVGGATAIAGVVAAPVIAGAALGAAGFTASGVAAGSAAAAVQSAVYGGSVAAGSIFALCQSAGATGVISAATAAGIGGVTGVSGVAGTFGVFRLFEMRNTSDVINLLVCGSGDEAHAVACIASSKKGTNVRMFSLDQEETDWNAVVEVAVQWRAKEPTHISYKAVMVKKSPEDAMRDVNMVVFVLPASAHQRYFEALLPHIKPGTSIVGLPGHPGFGFQAGHVLGDTVQQCTIVNFESLPWTCRTHELGMKCEMFGSKESLICAIKTGYQPPKNDLVATLQYLLGPLPELIVSDGQLLDVDLICVNAYLRPSIMYAQWEGWDGNPLDHAPLFYKGVTETTAKLISSISDEIVKIAELIVLKTGADMSRVEHIYEWYLRCYPDEISDKTNLLTAIQTNAAYQGLKHPVKMTSDGKYVPDFTHRYMTEDIPYGLVVIRGIAEIVGIRTPNIDKVLTWSQEKMNKEYLVNSKLQGKDIATSRAPQRYGLTTLEFIF